VTPLILLADDSPHAQRMGERILREEGFEVVTITTGGEFARTLDDLRPDVILADVFLPEKSGYELCCHVKSHEVHKHTGVVLIAGLLEPVDEDQAKRCGCDAVLKKPFEASVVLATVKPLIDRSRFERGLFSNDEPSVSPVQAAAAATPPPKPELDPEAIRAAVTLALDRSLPALIDEITEKVMVALGH
jgi:PleD family two-component response regulator